MKIAIHRNTDIFTHSSLWDREWEQYCKEMKIDYEIVNCFDNNILEKLKHFDILLWHFSGDSLQEMQFARTILTSAKNMGLRVFPDFHTSWHFDDKVAESYLLETADAPTPKNYVYYTKESALHFLKYDCSYPIIAKLRTGSGSNNVIKIDNYRQGAEYVNRMFGKGIDSSPKLFYKASSNLKSSKNIKTILNRIKRVPDFIERIKKNRAFSEEKGYVYFQEFIKTDGFDLKVVVVGDKLSFLSRDIRKGDFRASGGGSIDYDKNLITEEVRKVAFDLSSKLSFQCMGYDFVIDSKTKEPKIIEISYGFSNEAQIGLGGHWNSVGNWVDEPLNAPVEIIKNLIIY